MTRIAFVAAIVLFYACGHATAQVSASLRQKIEQIVSDKKAVVGVAIIGINGKERVSINGDRRFPMQSVFKFHIGLFMLSEIDRGKFSLDQKIEIKKSEMLPDTYSPIRDKYPDGVTLTISEILEYTISSSDNVGCDVLLRLLGGPKEVENYFVKRKFKDISIKINEEVMQSNWDMQFQNWTTPNAANDLLREFYVNKKKHLSQKSHDFIWKVMRETSTGQNRLKRQLPENTIVAHKTGTSGVNKQTGVSAAVNDMGIVFLPNGQHFYISVFVTDSKEDAATNEKMIADIAKAAWDNFTAKAK